MALISEEFPGDCFDFDRLSAASLGGSVLKREQKEVCFSFTGRFSILWIDFSILAGQNFTRDVADTNHYQRLVNSKLSFHIYRPRKLKTFEAVTRPPPIARKSRTMHDLSRTPCFSPSEMQNY